MCKRTGTVKRLLSLLIALVLTLSLSANKVQAISVPMLPYIPPSDVVQMDLLFNIFGITKPAIQDDVKRLQGYWSLIEMVMGASAEATKNKIEQMFEKARTSREWEIDPETISALNVIGSYAISHGVEYEVSANIVGARATYDKLMEWNRLNSSILSYSQYESMYLTASQELGGEMVVLALYSRYEGRDWCIEVGFAPKANYIRKTGKNNVAGMYNLPNVWVLQSAQTSSYRCVVYGQVNGGTWNRGTNPNNTYYGYDNKCITASTYFDGWGMTWEGTSIQGVTGTASVVAQNTQVSDALTQGDVIPITATTTLVNGAIDDTKPARIHLPTSLPVPAETVADLPTVQEQLGVVPISDDVTETVAQLQQAVSESVGSASDYAIDLTQYFPFCLPFDIFRIIGAFIAEPEAPKFSYVIVNPFANDGQHNIELEIDLSMFDQVAEVLRTLESILFVVGLCVVTRSFYLRG